jgi:predicted porin
MFFCIYRYILFYITKIRWLVLVLGLAGVVPTASAADLDRLLPKDIPLKDPLPDSLTWRGITFYGAIDIGYAYQTNGRPLGGAVTGLEYTPFTTTRNYTGQSVSTIAHSGLEQSKIGVRFDEPLGSDWSAIGKLETGFDPIKFRLSDGCNSLIQNAGVIYSQQTSNADSSRCGQPLNGEAYGGFRNPLYGTLTFGRQNSFQFDSVVVYDPLMLSYAFSCINAGSVSPQTARWDNSAKYIYRNGPLHAGVMYSEGGETAGMFGKGFGFNVGGNYQGFSLDGVYMIEHGAVNLQTAANGVVGSQPLASNISDNETWSLMGKYTYEFSGNSKNEKPRAWLTFFGGYTHFDQSNPRDAVFSGATAGGYQLAVSGMLPDNNAYTTDRILQFFWTGAKYQLSSGWNFTGAYYHANQNSFVADHAPCIAGRASRPDCVGGFDQVSFLVDYQITKHVDVYSGVTHARVENGLASGFPGTPSAKFGFAGTATSVETTSFMTGVRMKW